MTTKGLEEALSTALLTLAQRDVETHDEKTIDTFRKDYLAVMDSEDEEIVSAWKDIFKKAGETLAGYIVASAKPDAKKTQEPLFISLNRGQVFEFAPKERPVFIGLKEGCDVQLRGNASRLSGILFISPDTSEICLVDVGGISGFTVFHEGKKIKESKMGSRSQAYLKWDKTYVIEMGTNRVTLQPKMCIVCETKSRSQRFSCGHLTCCSDCAGKLDRCPLCRKPKIVLPEKDELYQSLNTMKHTPTHP